MTREAKQALTDYFARLTSLAQNNSASSDFHDDLVSTLGERIASALRESCDRRRVESVDAQMMLEVLLSIGRPEEVIKGSGLPPHRVLRRSSKDKWFMGVCGGFAEYWGVSSLLLRFLFLFTGIGVIAYIIIALIMPPSDYPEKVAMPGAGKMFGKLQTVLKGSSLIFMVLVLYLPLSALLLFLALGGVFKILGETGAFGWQTSDLWYYFVTGIPGYISGLSALAAGLGFFALLTQFFSATFFKVSLLNINTRKLTTVLAVAGLLVFSSFWIASDSLKNTMADDNAVYNFAATAVREIEVSFPGMQTPYSRKAVQIVGDSTAINIKVDVMRKVGGWNESIAVTNLESLKYICELTDDRKLRLAANIGEPAWNFYPYPEITFQVTVPEKQFLKISSKQLDGLSCDINVAKVSGPVNIDLQSGEIRLTSVSSPEITVKSEVGDIYISEVTADNLKVTSKVGDIQCSLSVASKAQLNTDVGSICIAGFGCDEVKIISKVGSIRLSRFVSRTTYIETQTGSINVKTDLVRPESELTIYSEVGSIQIELPEDCQPSLNIENGVGRIRNDFKGIAVTASSPKIQLKSNVGRISVRKARARGEPKALPALPAEAPVSAD